MWLSVLLPELPLFASMSSGIQAPTEASRASGFNRSTRFFSSPLSSSSAIERIAIHACVFWSITHPSLMPVPSFTPFFRTFPSQQF
jgi:hypothetical protein